MNASTEKTSVRSFLQQAAAKGRAAKMDHFASLLSGVHPGNVCDEAVRVSLALDDGMKKVLIAFRDKVPFLPTLMGKALTWAAEGLHKVLPNLPASARRDLRAVLFFVERALRGVPAADVSAAVDGLIETADVPTDVRKVLGLLAITAIAGVTPHAEPEIANRAALELWRIVRNGEPADVVEEAWDMAVACEVELEGGDRVPFTPLRAAG